MSATCSCDAANRGLNDSFKWLFYGDDDTVFFLKGAMNVVKDLDPNMPYFLTGTFCHQLNLYINTPFGSNVVRGHFCFMHPKSALV